jgi:hypothetical protein
MSITTTDTICLTERNLNVFEIKPLVNGRGMHGYEKNLKKRHFHTPKNHISNNDFEIFCFFKV